MAVLDATSQPRSVPQPVAETATWWTAWGCVAQVAVTSQGALRSARRLVERELAGTEKAAFRYRRDAEIHALYRAGGRAITVSPLLAELISAALVTAERTGGDVDPTVSAAVTRLQNARSAGSTGTATLPGCGQRAGGTRPAPGWQSVRLDGRRLQVPAGVTLDLSATAKALSCDRAAARAADRLGVGVSVCLGGNVATAGPAPRHGWTVHLEDRARGVNGAVVVPAGAAVSTSDLPGLVDPRTGGPVWPPASADATVWRSASVIGLTALEAAGYGAAALIRGPSARAWLTALGLPARLITVHDDELTVAGWDRHVPTTPVPRARVADPKRTTP